MVTSVPSRLTSFQVVLPLANPARGVPIVSGNVVFERLPRIRLIFGATLERLCCEDRRGRTRNGEEVQASRLNGSSVHGSCVVIERLKLSCSASIPPIVGRKLTKGSKRIGTTAPMSHGIS